MICCLSCCTFLVQEGGRSVSTDFLVVVDRRTNYFYSCLAQLLDIRRDVGLFPRGRPTIIFVFALFKCLGHSSLIFRSRLFITRMCDIPPNSDRLVNFSWRTESSNRRNAQLLRRPVRIPQGHILLSAVPPSTRLSRFNTSGFNSIRGRMPSRRTGSQ